MKEFKLGTTDLDGLTIAHLECGAGPLALCLHGFPDSAWTFEHLLPELAGLGYRAVAPFLRGYAPSDTAADGCYHPAAAALDANALHAALSGDDRAVIVGHDWGAFAAYGAASLSPESWRSVVTLAVPPGIGGAAIFSSYAQLKRSFYVMLFQLPGAEEVVAADDFAFIDGLWQDWCGDRAVAATMASRVKECLRGKGRTSAALGYYRALMQPVPEHLEVAAAALAATPSQPTLYLQGTADAAMGIELLDGHEPVLALGSRIVRIEGANHFLHLERPAEVNAEIVRWLAAERSISAPGR